MTRKPVLITGASSGIGYYCAKELSKNNSYQVYATVRNARDYKRLSQEGLNVLYLDLNSSDSIKQCAKEFLSKTDGKVYALFNNAGYGQPGAVEDISDEALKEQFQTNFFGLHSLTREFLPIMREQGFGRIINHSSVLGFVSLRFRGAYNASKYALEGLSDTLRLELMDSDIWVSLIETGPVRSNFRKNALKKFLENIDRQNSYFKDEYEKKLESLQSEKDVPFTLGEDAVYEVLLKALEEKEPNPRYRVTKVTTIFWFLKRVLSTKRLDKILRSIE